jgi:predicted AlkP superfamily phosphohydrolase/phosphomutase
MNWKNLLSFGQSAQRQSGQRTLVLGLDGFDIKMAYRFAQEGLMPNLVKLGEKSARYRLDHGHDKFSGLSWEHFCSGRSPSDGGRWSAVTFYKDTYRAQQEYVGEKPFMGKLPACKTVVFDVPYCDFEGFDNIQGLTRWGAHDPGVAKKANPATLHDEILERFGPYPGAEWIYSFSWPSVERTKANVKGIVDGVSVRSKAAQWLFKERLPDWDLAVVVFAEPHSAIEPLYHGIDKTHPLHNIPSAPIAGQGLRDMYAALDKSIGAFEKNFPDANLMVFASHGMGVNDGDLPSMVLLPELMYRWNFGGQYMKDWEWKGSLPDGTPMIGPDEDWNTMMMGPIPMPAAGEPGGPEWRQSWMPATRYARFWPKMKAFALPAYYDGRVRINLEGREAGGLVAKQDYLKTAEEIRAMILATNSLISGKPAVREVLIHRDDPMAIGDTEADLSVIWQDVPVGFSHPALGKIGPVPWRRTGGHTGDYGFMYVKGPGIQPMPGMRQNIGDTYGNDPVASTFDVVPTLIELLGQPCPQGISGRSLMAEMTAAKPARQAA